MPDEEQKKETTVDVRDAAPPSDPLYQAALDSRRPRLLAMTESQILRKTALDPLASAVTAEATANKLLAFREAIVKQFGPEAAAHLDELMGIARATRQANLEVRGGMNASELGKLHDKVRADYRLLSTDATSLVNRGLLDAERLENAHDVQGYQQTVESVLLHVLVLRKEWAKIEAHTPLTSADLDRAEATAQRMSSVLGDRDNGVGRAPAIELRVRALSSLVHTYDELRRMMTYLRWHIGDIDSLVPSLWAGRGGRKVSASDGFDTDGDVDGDDDGPSPATPSPNNGGAPFTE
jgi:hypothetical protein